MGMRAVNFAPDEWYHCFSRGVDKRQIFMDEKDGERFQMLLFVCNSTDPIHLSNLFALPRQSRQGRALPYVLGLKRGKPLVEIGSYCLMPNHPHLLLKEIDYGGISAFMQKIGTASTMYFNKKKGRDGALFSGRFKAIHVSSDAYLRRLVNYIHANPAELYEPGWKKGVIRSEKSLRRKLLAYPFSSLPDYEGVERPHHVIVAIKSMMEHLHSPPSFKSLLSDARVFYRQEKDVLRDLEV